MSEAKNKSEEILDDDWEVVEEQLVHVELSGGIFQDDLKSDPGIATKFVGLDTEQPVVQLGNQVFAGRFEDTIGTSVFFKREPVTAEEAARRDPVFDREAETKVEYVCKTSKKLVLKRIFLNAKSS